MLKYREISTRFYFLLKIEANFERLTQPSQEVTDVCVWTLRHFRIEQTFFLKFVELLSFLHDLRDQKEATFVVKKTQIEKLILDIDNKLEMPLENGERSEEKS